MARPTSPPPFVDPPPRSTSPTPRERIRSLFGGSTPSSPGNFITRAKSPTKGRNSRSNDSGLNGRGISYSPSPPVVSQLQLRPTPDQAEQAQLQAFPVSSPLAAPSAPVEHIVTATAQSSSRPSSPIKLQRTLSRRLSASSNTGSTSPTIFKRRPSAGISSSDLPNASSDVPPQQLESTSRSSSPTKSYSPLSPPSSPSKRNRPFPGANVLTRSRKASTGSIASMAAISRPSSPVKEFSQLSSGAQSPRKRAVDKSMIGLPTNFKHTSSGGGSTSSHSDAIQLAGLSSPSASGEDARRAAVVISRPMSPTRHRQRIGSPSDEMPEADYESAANKSLADSLAHINSALNGSTASESDESASLYSHQPTASGDSSSIASSAAFRQHNHSSSHSSSNRLDTVKEVPSGFIQRFEKAGQSPQVAGMAMGARGTRADARWLFGARENQEEEGEMERMDGLPPSDGGAGVLGDDSISSLPTARKLMSSRAMSSSPPPPASPSLRGRTTSNPGTPATPGSPATSPTRRGKRKAVPKLDPEDLQQTGTSIPLPPSKDSPVTPMRLPSSSPPQSVDASVPAPRSKDSDLQPMQPRSSPSLKSVDTSVPAPRSKDSPLQPIPPLPSKQSPSPPAPTSPSTAGWDATLAEISAALKIDADTNPALVGKRNWTKEELDVKWS